MESYNCFDSSGQHKYYTFLKELSCSGCEETDTVNIINMKSCEMLRFGAKEITFSQNLNILMVGWGPL